MPTAPVITLGDMLFVTAKADLNAHGMEAVGELATFLRIYPSQCVAIAGYTDRRGCVALNAELSLARAKAVRNALVRNGIEPSRIATRGMWSSRADAGNAAAGRRRGRRAQIGLPSGGFERSRTRPTPLVEASGHRRRGAASRRNST